ncbi:DNA polymerase alpha catalytic subunit, partial [Tanacetum coccineum]
IRNPRTVNRTGQLTGYKLVPGSNCLPLAGSEAKYIFGITHVPRLEDWPVMPEEHIGFMLQFILTTLPYSVNVLVVMWCGRLGSGDNDRGGWYIFGITHVPRLEDWPVMPEEHIGIQCFKAYPYARSQPHVEVALRLRKLGYTSGCFAGDTVPYIIWCEQGKGSSTSAGVAQRARHPDELKKDNENLMIDIDYIIWHNRSPRVSTFYGAILLRAPVHPCWLISKANQVKSQTMIILALLSVWQMMKKDTRIVNLKFVMSWLLCCDYTTLSLNLRVIGDSERGIACPNYPRCNGRLVRQYSEPNVLKQLYYFCYLLDANSLLPLHISVSFVNLNFSMVVQWHVLCHDSADLRIRANREYMTRIADLERNSNSLDERYNLSKTLEAAKHESLEWKRKYEVALSKQKAGEKQASLEVANLKARSSAAEARLTAACEQTLSAQEEASEWKRKYDVAVKEANKLKS